MKGGTLWDVIKDGEVNWVVVIEHSDKMGTKYYHVLLAMCSNFSISHFHCHRDSLFVVAGASVGENANVFPNNSWVCLHVVDLRADMRDPFCFGSEDFVLDLFR